jgi:predicted porin
MRRLLVTSLAVMVWLFGLGLSSLAEEAAKPTDKSAKQESSSSTRASKEEVQQLRSEVASQNQTIQELKTLVQQLAQRLGTTEASVLPVAATQGARVQTLGYPVASQQEEKPEPPGTAKTDLSPDKEKKKSPDKLEWSVLGGKVQLYGHSDVSYDYLDNGIPTSAVLDKYSVANGFLPGTAQSVLKRSNNGWLGQVSSNLSYLGFRGSFKLNSYLNGVFQVETEVNMSGTPGPTSDLQCRQCIGSRDTYVGLQGHWGAIKLGKEDAPYKRVSSPIDPFLNTIGDSRSIMGNSGGDNRAEFMSRTPHAVWYESPTYKGLSASLLFSPGQNRALDNSAYARGEPNCPAGNGAFTLSAANSFNVNEGADIQGLLSAASVAGGGNPFPLANTPPCNDGSWGNVLSTAVTYKGSGLYAFGAYEHHAKVNRTTDLIGTDDEAAWKFGAQYTIKPTRTTGNFVFEHLKRYGSQTDARLDERTRPHATWLAITQKITNKDDFNIGWAHAGKTPGDPGFCATVAPGPPGSGLSTCTDFSAPIHTVNNSSNLFDAGFRHWFTGKVSTYFVYARQANHADAHYDLGAVGHGIVVDKRDFLGPGYPGTRLQGLSAGMTLDF